MIHPTIATELPGIELESDRAVPSRVQVRSNRPDIIDRASDTRVTAGLNEEPEANVETRGVDAASDTNDVMNYDADQGVVPDGEEDELPELTPRYEEVDNDSDDEEDSVRNKQ